VSRLRHAVLGVPLFWKIVLANGFLMTVVGGTTTLVLSRPGHEAVAPAVLVILVLGTLMAATVVNAWIVALALRPLEGVSRTAEAVRLGDLSARAPVAEFSDRQLDHLAHVINEMLEALDQARERQKVLSHRVLMAEERERERIAGEIYAGTAQTLAGVLVRLQIILRRNEGQERAPLEELATEVRSALEEVRSFARRLRPPELDELGVRAALEAHARGLVREGGPHISFDGEVPESRLTEDARLALFRVVQEALTNAVRHSGAESVAVTFSTQDDGLAAVVEDRGAGFDLGPLEGQPPARLGLLTMIERAGYAEGMIHVDSAPGEGTRVRLVLPWKSGTPDGLPDPTPEPLPELARTALEPPGSR